MNVDNPAFRSLSYQDTEEYISDDPNFPYKLIPINGTKKFLDTRYSYFGYNAADKADLYRHDTKLHTPLTTGHFFSVNCQFQFSRAKGFIIQVPNFQSYNYIGGPIEAQGRLKYIDGCTDSLLISPVRKGDCCLNHLHFPMNISQTMHTHPSDRVGMVVGGKGICVTPWGNIDLSPGMLFIIKRSGGKKSQGLDGNMYENGSHCFYTTSSHMDVIAWHPDSDFGPEDEDHPMINRTMVNGVSASQLTDIQTK